MAITIEVKAGKDRDIVFVYNDAAGAPIDITGASAILTVRKSVMDAAIITVNAVITGASGTITFPLVPADTINILGSDNRETYWCDVELTLASGKKFDLWEKPLAFILYKSFVR